MMPGFRLLKNGVPVYGNAFLAYLPLEFLIQQLRFRSRLEQNIAWSIATEGEPVQVVPVTYVIIATAINGKVYRNQNAQPAHA